MPFTVARIVDPMKKIQLLKGFTFVELTIVIIIVSVMTIMAATRMPSVTLFQNAGFANTLIYDLNLTKVLSMSQNQRYRLVLGTSSYQIQNQAGVAITHPESTSTVVNYPTGVTVTPATTIIFDSLGQPYNAADSALTSTLSLMVSSTGTSQVINITPQTGFVQ